MRFFTDRVAIWPFLNVEENRLRPVFENLFKTYKVFGNSEFQNRFILKILVIFLLLREKMKF